MKKWWKTDKIYDKLRDKLFYKWDKKRHIAFNLGSISIEHLRLLFPTTPQELEYIHNQIMLIFNH